MELKSLRCFIHLSETLHFAKTAEAMHTSAPTLSRMIKRLEDEAGCVLLERDNRSVVLTEAGMQFLAFARQTLDAWQSFKQDTQTTGKALKGQLKVFCSVTACYSHIPPILARVSQTYPNIEILLETGAASLAMHKIADGSVDIALSARPEHLANNMAFHTIDNIPFSLIGPSSDCEIGRKLSSQAPDWQSIPFIMADAGLTRSRSDKWFRAHHIKPNIYATVAGHEAIVSMVALGCGIGLAPDIVIANSPVRDKVKKLEAGADLEPFELGVCCLHKHLVEPLVAAFWQEVISIGSELSQYQAS
ncbi:HTH-type transcriptional activator IlvY [Catenovulum sp. 2E275]|uniref:HTH-type transcriptional activator IlvY n=1 Tax=Catenovulum sp. 2E275 TaxID=2980497 RepID=UPI0021D35AD5|nr:HTH-type transcriptional activator IlvY [Catenovulum sp. 2E275]MCU4676319.1 HTH-type transcriptional activator IlvY [Catenovulum sp. 2E275]